VVAFHFLLFDFDFTRYPGHIHFLAD